MVTIQRLTGHAKCRRLEQNLTSVCSWHFHGQKYRTAKNASIRNRGDAYSPDTGRATRILLYINALALFRVTKYTTLKSVKWLLFSNLQVTQNIGDWNRTWHLVVSHPCPLVQPCCKCRNCCFFCFHVNLFLTFPWAKVQNRWKRVNTQPRRRLQDAYSPDTRRATRILLYISALGIFRVAKYTTLKSTKWLLFSNLQVTQNVSSWKKFTKKSKLLWKLNAIGRCGAPGAL